MTDESASKDQWYSARLLYERRLLESPDGPELPDAEPLFEESLIVFRADKDDDVVTKLMSLAERGSHDYKAVAGNWVKWAFREILEIQEISGYAIDDGTEVFYRWYHNPTKGDWKKLRQTQMDPWWLEEDDSAAGGGG